MSRGCHGDGGINLIKSIQVQETQELKLEQLSGAIINSGHLQLITINSIDYKCNRFGYGGKRFQRNYKE